MFGVADIRVKERLLRESDLTLEKSTRYLPRSRGQQRTDESNSKRQQLLRSERHHQVQRYVSEQKKANMTCN